MKKEETNDIVQFLIPYLEKIGIVRQQCKIDVTTEKTSTKRGDVWISKNEQTHKDFEKNIVALIEAKHRNCKIGDMDWRDAMRQGKEKAGRQRLTYYIVTNCISDFRFYNASNDEEINLDGKTITRVQPLEILEKIETQVNKTNSYVVHKASKSIIPFSEIKFRTTLKKLADIYRSAGLKKGDERIDPTVSFVVLKYIGEKEKERRTLPEAIKLWDDLSNIAIDENADLKGEFDKINRQIWGKKSEYKDNLYKDFRDLLNFSPKLKNQHFKKIYKELNGFHFHGCNFDLYGSIYEEFASQTKKKEFGEFYTRRHITGVVARLLLRNEITGRDLKICDPACGTGGFLTEAYKSLVRNYSMNDKLNEGIIKKLENDTFWGLDNDEKSVARTKLNMFLVGDGHTHIYEIDDSLDWIESIEWKENGFEYIMTNPPMGKYEGGTRIEDFKFTNERRYELLFAEKIIKAIKHGHDIAVVINDGALEAPTRENFRKKLLQHCDIYVIISLTKFAFAPYTKEKTYILFMRKKQEEGIGTVQEFPIWHFVVDYDGFANSDKRYRTKYHDDLPELEEKFDEAEKLARISLSDKERFEREKGNFEREVNEREREEGLTGMKYGYVEMAEVNEENYHNLLSEYHLRPYKEKRISEEDFDKRTEEILKKLKNIFEDVGK